MKQLEKDRRVLVKQLRNLLKPRLYLIRLWGIYSLSVEAAWISDTSVSIEKTDFELLPTRRKRPIDTYQLQAELSAFQDEVNIFCAASDALAKQLKEKKSEFFEDILAEAEGT